MTPDIEACSFDIEETWISKFFGSFDIEVLNNDIEVLDFDVEVTSISKYRSTSKYVDIAAYFDTGGGKVPDANILQFSNIFILGFGLQVGPDAKS